MCTSRVLAAFVLAVGGMVGTGVARGEGGPLVAVDFEELRGALNLQAGGTGGTFTANAVYEPGRLSFGTVWRGRDPAGEALFDTGFVGEPNPADAVVSLTLGAMRDKRAEFTGTAEFTDVDGDTITMFLTGVLLLSTGHASANADITGIQVASDEGLFDGTDGGSVSVDEFDDARGSLVIEFNYPATHTGGGFTHLGSASVVGDADGPRSGGPVPAPSSAAVLLGSALMLVGRRRGRENGGPS